MKKMMIQWPATWNPEEGWPTALPGVSQQRLAEMIERLGGPRAPREVRLRVVILRVNRRLAKKGERLRKFRGAASGLLWENLGDYYIVDEGNRLVAGHVNVEQLAHELGVIRSHESIGGRM